MYVSLKLLVRPIVGDPEADQSGDKDKANGRKRFEEGRCFSLPLALSSSPQYLPPALLGLVSPSWDTDCGRILAQKKGGSQICQWI